MMRGNNNNSSGSPQPPPPYVDRTAAAVEYCQSAAGRYPAQATVYQTLQSHLQNKLWHQLTVLLLQVLSSSSSSNSRSETSGPTEKTVADADADAAELYDKVVLAVDAKLHPVSVARMAVLTAQHLQRQNDLISAKAVMENCLEKLQRHHHQQQQQQHTPSHSTLSFHHAHSSNNNTTTTATMEAIIYLQSKHAMLTLQELLQSQFALATASDETKAALAHILETVIQTNAPIVTELSAATTATSTTTTTTKDTTVHSTTLVHAAHYETAMTYYKLVGPAASFYEQAMQYLHYAPSPPTEQDEANDNETDRARRLTLAVDLCLAALTGEGIYNLTAVTEQTAALRPLLLHHDDHDDHRNSHHPSYAWLLELLQTVAAGDILRFRTLVVRYASEIARQPALVHGATTIQEKLTLTALVLAVLSIDRRERCVSFADIARWLHFLDDDNSDHHHDEINTSTPTTTSSSSSSSAAVNMVEWVLMRACAVHLLEAQMDQVDQTVHITWVQPRHLTSAQMAALAVQYGSWAEIRVPETTTAVKLHHQRS